MPLLVHHNPVELTEAKEHLRANGWSYRVAARELGISPQWLNDVLNGWQVSKTLVRRLMSLPQCPPDKMSTRARNRMTQL